MIVTVEELKRLEDTDIRDLRREDLDNAGDIVIDRQKSANQRMREFLEKTKNPSMRFWHMFFLFNARYSVVVGLDQLKVLMAAVSRRTDSWLISEGGGELHE